MLCFIFFFFSIDGFFIFFFFFQAEDGIRDHCVTGVQTCALPISSRPVSPRSSSLSFQGFGQISDAFEHEIGLSHVATRPPFSGPYLYTRKPGSLRASDVRLRIVADHGYSVGPETHIFERDSKKALLRFTDDDSFFPTRILEGGDEGPRIQREPATVLPVAVLLQRHEFRSFHEAAKRRVETRVSKFFSQIPHQYDFG